MLESKQDKIYNGIVCRFIEKECSDIEEFTEALHSIDFECPKEDYSLKHDR